VNLHSVLLREVFNWRDFRLTCIFKLWVNINCHHNSFIKSPTFSRSGGSENVTHSRTRCQAKTQIAMLTGLLHLEWQKSTELRHSSRPVTHAHYSYTVYSFLLHSFVTGMSVTGMRKKIVDERGQLFIIFYRAFIAHSSIGLSPKS